jgi:hypothetical protein
VAEDLERTALGIVMALERGDGQALPTLLHDEDGPVDDLELIVMLGRIALALAGQVGLRSDPPQTAAEVLSQLALEWGDSG